MTTKAIEQQVVMELAGVDAQVILGDLHERHDPMETAGLGALYRLIGALPEGRERDAALDMCGRLIYIDRRENTAHLDARQAVGTLTGQVAKSA